MQHDLHLIQVILAFRIRSDKRNVNCEEDQLESIIGIKEISSLSRFSNSNWSDPVRDLLDTIPNPQCHHDGQFTTQPNDAQRRFWQNDKTAIMSQNGHSSLPRKGKQ